jgi:hypothetical protein
MADTSSPTLTEAQILVRFQLAGLTPATVHDGLYVPNAIVHDGPFSGKVVVTSNFVGALRFLFSGVLRLMFSVST